MFFKALFWNGPSNSPSSFWQGFACVVKPFKEDKDQKRPIFPFARVSFEETSAYNYSLVLENIDDVTQIQRWTLSPEMRVTLTLQRDLAIFVLHESDSSLMLEFPSADENYDNAGLFRDVLGRVLFQMCTKKNIDDHNLISAEVKKRIEVVGERGPTAPSEKLKNTIRKHMSNCVLFLEAGRWGAVDPQNTSNKLNYIDSDCALGVRARSGFLYELFVLSNEGTEIYSKKLTEQFYYYADSSRHALTWLELNHDALCYQFVMFEANPHELRKKISICILESQHKESFEAVVAKNNNDWDKFYLTPAVRAQDDLRLYPPLAEKNSTLRYSDSSKPAEGRGASQAPIKHFQQAKTLGLCFSNRGSDTEVYFLKPESESGVEFKTCLPSFRTKAQIIIPRQILLTNEDRSLALLEESNPNKLYYNDLEKGEIVREWHVDTHLREISLAGGKSGGEGLLAVARKEIIGMDPRMKNLIAKSALYATDYNFEKILGTHNDGLVVGSANGDLRLYNQIAGRAKNLIPAPISGQIRSLDCSVDGNFLLVAYEKSVLLLPTFQNGRSAFACTLLKSSKPGALVLQISPLAMARYKITELNFRSAKFDEKSGSREKHIVAATGEFLVLWDLAEALQGRLVSSNVKRMNGTIIGSEFCYDRDELLGASANALFIQSTRKIPITESFNK